MIQARQRRLVLLGAGLAGLLIAGLVARSLMALPAAETAAGGAAADTGAAGAATVPGTAADGRIVAQAQVVPIDGIIEVRPLAEGRVLRVLVRPGDRVAADQLLAEIESDLPAAAVRQRQAEMQAAADRAQLTGEGVQGFVSEQAVTEAERSFEAALARQQAAALRAAAGAAGGRAADVRVARAQLRSAAAALSQDRVVLGRTRIVAPIGGVVMARNVNPGDIIGANVSAPTLFRIVDPQRTEVRFEFEEAVAPRIAIGLPVDYCQTGSKTVVGHGSVTRIAPQVEKRSIGADDARIRADSMVRPAWGDFTPLAGAAPLPVNFRLEARVQLDNQETRR